MAFPHVQEAGDPVPPRPCLESVISQPLLVLAEFFLREDAVGCGSAAQGKVTLYFHPRFFFSILQCFIPHLFCVPESYACFLNWISPTSLVKTAGESPGP